MNWILGAKDAEMDAIETLLRWLHQTIHYAMYRGKRCTKRTAYKADRTYLKDAVLVECHTQVGTRIDHHRPGDYGYDGEPRKYMSHSSLGQVITHLIRRGVQVTLAGRTKTHAPQDRGAWSQCQRFVSDGDQWIKVSHNLRCIAAADHCLRDAYRGSCPSVCPLRLEQYRTRLRCATLNRTVKWYSDLMEQNYARLTTCETISWDGYTNHVLWLPETIRELPETTARTDLSVLTKINGRLMLFGRPEEVDSFLAHGSRLRFRGWEFRLEEMYGCPQRGYASGKITKEWPHNPADAGRVQVIS